MNLTLNRSEARTLLKLLYLADSVLGPGDGEVPEAFLRKCEAVMDKVLAAAQDSDCEDMLEEDIDGRPMLSPEIGNEPGVVEAILEHEGSVFWEELVSRLAERDYELHTGQPVIPDDAKEIDDISDEEWEELHEKLEQFESSYWTEFEKHGVRNIHVVRGTGPLS
jgi:hypothetical protein